MAENWRDITAPLLISCPLVDECNLIDKLDGPESRTAWHLSAAVLGKKRELKWLVDGQMRRTLKG